MYDTYEWDPLEGYEDYVFQAVPLDLQEMEQLGKDARQIMQKYDLPEPTLDTIRVEGEEVGDDRIDLSNNSHVTSSVMVCQEKVSRMVTSWRDTNISRHLWNFTETTSIVPTCPEQSFDRCRKVDDFGNLGFIDTPPLRIILDARKGDMSHSSTSVGKATMLGSRMRTPRTEFLQGWYLASYLQDGYLRSSRSADPKYLPQIMGGSGVRAPFGVSENLYLYVHGYRGGRCQRIYGSATQELRLSLESLERGQAAAPILCTRLRDRQEYLHGTYAGKILIPSREQMSSFMGSIPRPFIRASGGANLFANFENRLQRTRHLITRTGAEREWEQTCRIRAKLLVRGQTVPEAESFEVQAKAQARGQFGGALRANTALAHLMEKTASMKDVLQLIGEGFTPLDCGVTAFTKWDADWLFSGGRSSCFSIEDLTLSEDLFLRKEVSEDESMRVGGIPLRPVSLGGKQVVTTTTIGLYKIGSGMFEWAENLAGRLETLRDKIGVLSSRDALTEYEKNPEWVNDDTMILAMCRQDTANLPVGGQTVILVSADKRLGHQLSDSCNVEVVRVDPMAYIRWTHRTGRDPLQVRVEPRHLLDGLLTEQEGRRVKHCYVDTGSVAAMLARVELGLDDSLHIRRLISSSDETDHRTYRYSITKMEDRYRVGMWRHYPTHRTRRFAGVATAPRRWTRSTGSW